MSSCPPPHPDPRAQGNPSLTLDRSCSGSCVCLPGPRLQGHHLCPTSSQPACSLGARCRALDPSSFLRGWGPQYVLTDRGDSSCRRRSGEPLAWPGLQQWRLRLSGGDPHQSPSQRAGGSCALLPPGERRPHWPAQLPRPPPTRHAISSWLVMSVFPQLPPSSVQTLPTAQPASRGLASPPPSCCQRIALAQQHQQWGMDWAGRSRQRGAGSRAAQVSGSRGDRGRSRGQGWGEGVSPSWRGFRGPQS